MSAISPTDLLSDQSLSRCPDHISSPFGLFYTHASRVQKFLDSAREELRAYFGDRARALWNERSRRSGYGRRRG